MANKNRLRELRADTIINVTAKKQESELIQALYKVVEYLAERFAKRITLTHENQWYLKDIVNELMIYFPDTDLHYHFEKSHIRPDGGILAIKSIKDNTLTYPILISEVKNQGQTIYGKKKDYPSKQKEMLLNALERI